jgi:hypothetical protein
MASVDSANPQLPTVVTVPCFSGAPWELEKLTPLSHLPLKTRTISNNTQISWRSR